ncbi:hypothetical protein [Algoriphagus confluentis]|uniref:PepSY domain-containing protein n=1 Tax=Algoriphagus confluentis TaxID=1697556 RepID=A0ABQ6PVL9_9BACT|nr:hypothetical protein Aconfl_42620 [Algoriphagus confluentis]
MKKTILMSALLVAGAAFVQPAVAAVATESMEIILQEEKVQINPDELPEPVKTAIVGDESLQGAAVAEAWKITKEDGTVYFKITFANAEGTKMDKNYDPEGNEIK